MDRILFVQAMDLAHQRIIAMLHQWGHIPGESDPSLFDNHHACDIGDGYDRFQSWLDMPICLHGIACPSGCRVRQGRVPGKNTGQVAVAQTEGVPHKA